MENPAGTKVLKRAVTRDLPLFVISASYGTHLRDISKDMFGFAFTRNFVLLDRGTAAVHRDDEEWYTETPRKLAAALQDTTNHKGIKQCIAYTEHSINSLNSVELAPSTTCLDELRQVIAWGVPGMILAHWLPIFNEQKLAVYDPDDVRYLESSRQKIEKFFGTTAHVAYTFIDVVAETYGVHPLLLKYATHEELKELLTFSRIDTTVLEARRNQQLLFVEDGLYSGEAQINALLSEQGYVLDTPASTHIDTLYGAVACEGSLKGTVQVINSREQFDQFKEGNILVAPMTSPEYTPLIRKAKAIITDEGGMLSHAAIVSRELNKPCIIGTKSASYHLKDNQEVDINAEWGTVKVLR